MLPFVGFTILAGATKTKEKGGMVGDMESVKTIIILKPKTYKKINKKIKKNVAIVDFVIEKLLLLRLLQRYGHNSLFQ